MKRKKTLVVVFWDLGIGGIQTRFVEVINYLLKNNSELKVILLLKRRLVDEISVKESANLELRFFSPNRPREHGKYKSEPTGFGLWLIYQLVKIKPTHLLTFLCRYSLIGFIYKIISFFIFCPVLWTINEGIYTSTYLIKHEKPIWKYFVSISYKLANQVIAPTKAIKDDLHNNFGVFNSRIKVIPSWVKRKKSIVVKKKYDGIFVGRLSPEKGIDVLVELLIEAKKRKSKIAVVGDGELREWFESQLWRNKLDDVVDYFGYLPRKEVFSMIRKSKLVILPSENEGLPMIMLESASVGVSTLVTNLPGMDEVIINGKNGFILKKEDFVSKYFKILGNKKLIKTNSDQALINVRSHHSVDNLSRFADLVCG